MATSRVENMTIGELSDRVLDTNTKEDQLAEQHNARIVSEATARVLSVIVPPIFGIPHEFRPHRKGHCYACCYASDHMIHKAA